MIDGLWTAIFHSGSLAGGGVIVLRDGQVTGGDAQYFYVGTYTYEPKSQVLTAQARIVAFVAGAISIFGVPANFFDVTLKGRLNGDTGVIEGFVNQTPQLRFTIQLVKRLGVVSENPTAKLG